MENCFPSSEMCPQSFTYIYMLLLDDLTPPIIPTTIRTPITSKTLKHSLCLIFNHDNLDVISKIGPFFFNPIMFSFYISQFSKCHQYLLIISN